MAQRGHDESEESLNKGNFFGVDSFAKRDPLFKKKLNEIGRNAKYIYSSIHNELLEILENEVMKNIRNEVNEA